MIKRPLLAGLLGGCLALPAMAEPVLITEYPGMTRITVPFVTGGDWRVKRSPGKIALTTAVGDAVLSAKAVTPDSRLSTLSVWKGEKDSGIDIAYTCDCTPGIYTNDARQMVIDLKQNDAPSLVPATVMVRSPARSATASGWNASRKVAPSAAPRPAPIQPRQVAQTPEAPVRPRALRALAEGPRRIVIGASSADESLAASPVPRARPRIAAAAPKAPRPANVSESDASIDAIRKSVLSQLDAAADEGVIQLSQSGRLAAAANLPPECPDEAALDFARLVDTSSFRGPLPELRAAVFDDMKQLSAGSVRALARHFIAFGLGPEARSVFESFGTEGDVETTMLDMAAFLEGNYDALKDSALFQKACGPRAAIWRTALAAVEGSGTVSDLYPVTDGLVFRLPDALNKILGAQIALGLFDEGDSERAMRLWRALDVAGGPETPEMRLLAAYTRPPNAPPETILPRLIDVAETRQPESAEAALRAATILETTFDNDSAGRLRSDLDDLIFAYRGSAMERPLVLARTRLNARYGDLNSALEDLQARIGAEPAKSEEWRRLIQQTIKSAVKQADAGANPADFNAILKAQVNLDASPEADESRVTLARKLIDAGGAHLIDKVITPQVFRRSSDARKVFADALVRRGLADKAMLVLARSDDDESLAMKERIRTLGATDMRVRLEDRFDALPTASTDAPLTYARDLLEGSISDLNQIEEIMTDG